MHKLGTRNSGRCRRRERVARALVGSLIAGLAAGLTAAAAAAAPQAQHLHTVVRGLDNPRGLIFLPDGKLAVAEAGHASNFCLGPGLCGGLTGRIVAVNPGSGHARTLAAGFPSIGGPFAPFGLGALAVSRGKLYAIVGENPQEFGNPNKDCMGQPPGCVAKLKKIISKVGNFVRVRSLSANHGWRSLSRVGRFDFNYVSNYDRKHPHNVRPDGDPFGLIVRPAGGFYVIDAASNTLGALTVKGGIRVLDLVPGPPHHNPIPDAAPTCVVRTPGGGLVIGTESGVLWRWQHHHLRRLLVGGKVQQVVGCVADAHGNLYLANLDHSVKHFIGKPFTGSVVKVTPKLRTSYIAQGLNYPTGITLGPDGRLYVTDNGLCPTKLSLLNSKNSPPHACPGAGKVVRLDKP